MKKLFAVVPLALGTITTGNERANRPASHLGELSTMGMVWQSNGNGNLWVRGDLGSAQAIDFMSMIWANASEDTTIRLRLGASQAAVDGGAAPFDSGALPFIAPAITRKDGLYSSHLELDDVQTYRWWRIDIVGHTGDFAAAGLVLGEKVQSDSYPNPGWGFAATDLGQLDIARNRVPENTPGAILRALKFKVGWVPEEDWEEKWRPIQEMGNRVVTYWCFDPEAGPYRQARSYLGYNDLIDAAGGALVRRYEMDVEVRSLI